MNVSNSSGSEFILKLSKIVEANLADENFGLKELARKTRISRTQLHRKLKSINNQSVSQFIREIRLNKAKEMLQQDLGTVSEIAYKVGFGSLSYFIKCFHEYFGYPPGVVLKLHPENMAENSKDETSQQNTTLGTEPKKSRESVKLLIGILGILTIATIAYFIYRNFMPEKQAVVSEKSIAVLPFKSLSEDEENQHFADGLVDDLLSRLATINEFKVISRTSSETYRNEDSKKIPVIASELGVTYILEGSVRKYDNKVRITVQLIDAKRDDHVWIESFDRNLADIFKLQSEIALQIAKELDVVLLTENKEDILVNKTSNFAAYEAYSLGRFHWNKRTLEGFKSSIKYFEDAIDLDSLYGLAYAGLADTYNLMAITGLMDMTEGRNRAVALAKKALTFDTGLAQAHNVLASIYTYIDWNWELAEQEYLEAIKLNPNYSTAYHYYSEHLSIVGRHDDARKMINKAIELDPLSSIIRRISAKLYMGQGEFKKAMAENIRGEELQKNHPSTFGQRFLIYYYQNEYSNAYEALKDYIKALNIKLPPRFDSNYSKIKMEELIKWAIENKSKASNGAGENQFNIYQIAILYAILGDNEKALTILEAQFNKVGMRPEFTFDYAFRNMHNNPRFKKLLEKMNLPER